jgi:acetyltransferase
MAGGETRDTVPECLELTAAHPDVDAIIFLGVGIQSNLADLEKRGRFYPGYGLERVVQYHERQDVRYATAAVELARKYEKPILVATELAETQPENPGPRTLRELGSFAFSSSYRAVTALEQMVRYGKWRARRAAG